MKPFNLLLRLPYPLSHLVQLAAISDRSMVLTKLTDIDLSELRVVLECHEAGLLLHVQWQILVRRLNIVIIFVSVDIVRDQVGCRLACWWH